MGPTLNENFRAQRPTETTRVTRIRDDVPDFYERPRKRLPTMVVSGMAFVVAAAGFYGAEAFLPPSLKPSHFTGGYERAMAQARTEGELISRINYDRKAKLIETAAMQVQEKCKASLMRSSSLYQATWNRANLGYQIAGDLQKQYAQTRVGTASATLGGETGIINLLSTIGYIGAVFDPEFGHKTLELADGVRQQALQKIDEAARSGVVVDTGEWNKGLPDPQALPPLESCDLPATLLPDSVNAGA